MVETINERREAVAGHVYKYSGFWLSGNPMAEKSHRVCTQSRVNIQFSDLNCYKNAYPTRPALHAAAAVRLKGSKGNLVPRPRPSPQSTFRLFRAPME